MLTAKNYVNDTELLTMLKKNNMDKFDELLEKLNSLKLIQELIDWEECLPEDIWKEHFENSTNYQSLVTGLEVDKHRHYETSISVIKIYGRFLGIQHVTDVYSEQMDVSDCYFEINFFEMAEKQTITYIKI